MVNAEQQLVLFLQDHPRTIFSPKTLARKTGLKIKHVVKIYHKSNKIRLAKTLEVGSMKHKLTLLTINS
jgi:hypothetical protein